MPYWVLCEPCLKILGHMRFKNTNNFLDIMDSDESQELHEFSVGLFD